MTATKPTRDSTAKIEPERYAEILTELARDGLGNITLVDVDRSTENDFCCMCDMDFGRGTPHLYVLHEVDRDSSGVPICLNMLLCLDRVECRERAREIEKI